MSDTDTSVIYRLMRPGEEAAVCAMVERCFNAFIAPGYAAEGAQEFLSYARPERLAERVSRQHLVLVAEADGLIAGMIEMRGEDHVSLLFVDAAYQRRGISRELLRQALALCRARRPDLRVVTVNSSPYAVPVYERLGFRPLAQEQQKNGIRYTPMALELPAP